MTKIFSGKKKNIAFTLIELLAIVVVLAVILVIAIPKVLSVVNTAKRDSFLIDAKSVVKTIENEIIEDRDFIPNDISLGSLSTVFNIETSNYDSVYVKAIDGVVRLAIVGKSKWEGFTACGTYDNMEILKGEATCDVMPQPTPEVCFTFDSETKTITDYDRDNPVCTANLIIPSTIGGVSVEGLGTCSLWYKELTSVVIPNSVRHIDMYAFSYNPLTNINIPEGVTDIDYSAFSGNKLTSISIPSSVTYLSEHAFNDNQLPDSKAFIYKRNSDGTEDRTTVISYGGAKRSNIEIPSGVTRIGYTAFGDNGITSITIPDSVTSIGSLAFKYNQLTSITIPDNVTEIGSSAFYANELTSVVIPSGVTYINDSVFEWNQLASVTIPDSVTSIGNSAFESNMLTNVTIPTGVTYIGDSAFKDNELTSINIPSGVTSIGDSVFRGNQLASITIPNNVTSIGNSAFYYNQLTSITIPSSVTRIGTSAFHYNQLTSITIPSSVTNIGVSAFEENLLTDVTIEGTNPHRFDGTWIAIGFPESLYSPVPVDVQEGTLSTASPNNYPFVDNTYYEATVSTTGLYKLEVWGAAGGYRTISSNGGAGGYSVGEINLTAGDILNVYVGGSGSSGSYNGGGIKDSYPGGGGATDIRIGGITLYHRFIVAGGGGSDGATYNPGGYGGGTSGQTRTESCGDGGYGGTQTDGGSGGSSNDGTFGLGGVGIYRANGYGGAGGGGWYGGGGTYPDGSGDDDRGGGGGSGFVWTSSSASNVPSGYLVGSQYYLSNAQTIEGNASMPNPSGGTMTGNLGNGYARITYLGA